MKHTNTTILEYALVKDALARCEGTVARAHRASFLRRLRTELNAVAGKSLAARARAIRCAWSRFEKPRREPRTVLATGWGATTMQLARDRKSILVRAPKNPVFSLADAQCLADGLVQLIAEARRGK